MENNVNSKTTKTIRRKIGSVYAVPCINEETLTKWDQIFEVYFSEKPFNEAKKIPVGVKTNRYFLIFIKLVTVVAHAKDLKQEQEDVNEV